MNHYFKGVARVHPRLQWRAYRLQEHGGHTQVGDEDPTSSARRQPPAAVDHDRQQSVAASVMQRPAGIIKCLFNLQQRFLLINFKTKKI